MHPPGPWNQDKYLGNPPSCIGHSPYGRPAHCEDPGRPKAEAPPGEPGGASLLGFLLPDGRYWQMPRTVPVPAAVQLMVAGLHCAQAPDGQVVVLQ